MGRTVPKNVKGGTLWDFLNIHPVAKYQKIDGVSNKKISEKNEKFEHSHTAEKRGKVSQCQKKWKGGPSALEWLFISC